jgi:hypothetical protein
MDTLFYHTSTRNSILWNSKTPAHHGTGVHYVPLTARGASTDNSLYPSGIKQGRRA